MVLVAGVWHDHCMSENERLNLESSVGEDAVIPSKGDFLWVFNVALVTRKH